jgi:allantoin racemase
MTMKIGAAAKAAASLEVEISAVNPGFGPASIEGYFDKVFSIPGPAR